MQLWHMDITVSTLPWKVLHVLCQTTVPHFVFEHKTQQKNLTHINLHINKENC